MNEHCTIYQTVDFISKKWTLLIILELYKSQTGKQRYSYLKNHLPGITPKILSTRLKELEKQKIITKKVDTKKFPIKCEYALTESGKDIIRIIKDLKQWALRWKIQNEECAQQDCKDCDL
ncbi:MAG: helix-turn-helix domain-containing protein [Methanobacteriota archaeon]